MTIQVAGNPGSTSINMRTTHPHDKVSDGSALKVYDAQKDVPAKVKVGVFLTTLAGVTAAMLFSLKKHNLSLNPFKNLFKSPKNWGIFNEKLYSEKELPWLVSKLAIGSVGGGLIGGAIFDKKENMKAKFREAIIQLVGNIFTPLLCVAGGGALFKKYLEPGIIKKLNLNGKAKGVPKAIATGLTLVGAIFLGNKVGNTINQKVFNVDDNRKLKLTDMSPHIDDLCLSLTLGASDSKIGTVLSKFIPAALMVAGYSTGVTQEHHGHKHSKHDKENKAV